MHTHIIMLTVVALHLMILLPSKSADPTPTIIIDIGRQEAFKQKKIKSQNYSRNFPSIIYHWRKKALEQCEGLRKKG